VIATLLTFLSLVTSAKICPPLASEGAVLKKNPLSSKVVKPGEVAACEIIPSAPAVAAAESTQVESALTTSIFFSTQK